jgi:hypothetical protein
VIAALLAAALLLAQLGSGTPGQRPLDRLENSVKRPLPSLPPAAPPRSDMVWVPDRYVDREGSTFHVPGHWEQRLNPREHYVPPLTICDDASGACTQVPAGVRPPPESRQEP